MYIEWDKLPTTITTTHVIETSEEVELPKGQYQCPNCEGTGQYYLYKHGCPGIIHNPCKRLYEKCFLCGGTGIIKKCKSCDEVIQFNEKECHDCLSKRILKREGSSHE